MNLINLGVAGVDRGIVSQVIHNASIGNDFSIFLETVVIISRRVINPAEAATQDHMQVIAGVQPGGGIKPFILAYVAVLDSFVAIGRRSHL
ncbi:hypothetical protein D3C80_1173800 [compost metagenome]